MPVCGLDLWLSHLLGDLFSRSSSDTSPPIEDGILGEYDNNNIHSEQQSRAILFISQLDINHVIQEPKAKSQKLEDM